MPAQRRTSIGTLRNAEFSAPSKIAASTNTYRSPMKRRASLGGDSSSNLDALQAASLNSRSSHGGQPAAGRAAGGASGRPTIKRSVSMAAVRTRGGGQSSNHVSLAKRAQSGKNRSTYSYSNDTGMSNAAWGMCTPKRTTSKKCKVRKDDEPDDISIDCGPPAQVKRTSSRTMKKNMASSSHGQGSSSPLASHRAPRVKSHRDGGDGAPDTPRRRSRRSPKRPSDGSLGSVKSIIDADLSSVGEISLDEGIQRAASKVYSRLSPSKVHETPRRTTSKSKLPSTPRDDCRHVPKRTSSKTKLPTMAVAGPPEQASRSPKRASPSKQKGPVSLKPLCKPKRQIVACSSQDENGVPPTVTVELPANQHEASCLSHDDSPPCHAAPPPATQGQYNPNMWNCTCGFQLGVCMKFCGMCRTAQHWKCNACQFDQNLCVFKFCGGCAAAKPLDTDKTEALASSSKKQDEPASPSTIILLDLEYI